MINNNNRVTIVGQVIEMEFSHEFRGENFYRVWVCTGRLSGIVDTLPVIISELLLELRQVGLGCSIQVNGQYRSRNKDHKLSLYVFATEISLCCNMEENRIILNGYICKQPIYRQTPSGREITDTMLAVHRPNKKSDYIPIICWGRNALYTSTLSVATNLIIEGRIQSREYQKEINGQCIIKTAFEVSVSNMTEIITEECSESLQEKSNG